MLNIIDEVARAKKAQEESFLSIRPKLYRAISKLFTRMIEQELNDIALRIADEDGLRAYYFYCEPHDRHPGLYRVLITQKPLKVQPIFSVEFFSNSVSEGIIPGVNRTPTFQEGLDLWSFLDDLEHSDRHAQFEADAQSATVVLKTRSH